MVMVGLEVSEALEWRTNRVIIWKSPGAGTRVSIDW